MENGRLRIKSNVTMPLDAIATNPGECERSSFQSGFAYNQDHSSAQRPEVKIQFHQTGSLRGAPGGLSLWERPGQTTACFIGQNGLFPACLPLQPAR
jgi:hypothetical protein